MTTTNKLSPLEEWAYELDPDYPQDGTIDAIKIQTHRELMRKRSTQGAMWLFGQAREWCDEWTAVDGDIKLCHLTALDLLEHLEQLCGKEAKS